MKAVKTAQILTPSRAWRFLRLRLHLGRCLSGEVTALSLAPCALGGGNSDQFAEATGLDRYAETAVRELLLSMWDFTCNHVLGTKA
jgi:hypothetical protein